LEADKRVQKWMTLAFGFTVAATLVFIGFTVLAMTIYRRNTQKKAVDTGETDNEKSRPTKRA
jgi:uncharacterized membrane protein YidH (DUF202 family)